jgi:penicillin-binding protein 1C
MSRTAAALVLDVLADPVARVPGFGLETPLDLPFPAAAKTGTSRYFTDNWAVAVTGGFTVATWVGNFSGRAMEGVSGVTGAAPLMHRVALRVSRRYSPGTLRAPRDVGAVSARICRRSGLIATDRCPPMTEWVQPDRVPMARCDWHEADGVRLPAEYAEWAGARAGGPTGGQHEAPLGVPPGRRPDFRIVSPQDGDRYRIPPGVPARYVTLSLVASAPEGVRWYVDGRAVRSGRWPLAPGTHVVRAEMNAGPGAEVRIEVE